MTEQEIRKVVSMTVDELTDRRMLNMCNDDFVYIFMGMKLRQYYADMNNHHIACALEAIKNDPYYELIPMYYKRGMTITAMAVELARDRATISRNKKRLVLKLYDIVYGE